MPLESATYISDLDPSNPVGSVDLVSSLDDHMRLVKATLQTTFPGIEGAVTATHTELSLLDGVTGTTGTGRLVLDDAPTIADLTVTDSITLPAASVADAALSPNVALLNATNVFDTGGGAPRIGVQRDGTLYTFNVDSGGSLRIVRQEGEGADTVRVDAGLRSGSLTVDGAAGIGGAATFSNNVTVGGTISGNGSGLTSLNASNLSSGTVPGARLGGNQTMAGNKTFSGDVTIGGATRAATIANSTSTTLTPGQIHHVTGNCTVPTLTAGQWVAIVNHSSSPITLTRRSGTALYWTLTGENSATVTIGPRGRVVVSCAASGSDYVSGDIVGST